MKQRHTIEFFAVLINVILSSVVLFVTGCGKSQDESQSQVDRTPAPAISLEAAVIQGNDQAVHEHITAETPINTPNLTGDTPLSIASVMGQFHAADALIKAGAELEIKNSSGTTALFNAAFFCHPDIVRELINAGADTSTTDANGIPILQIMQMPWEQIEPVYAAVFRAIEMPFDTQRIKSLRPQIVDMLR